jgi:hypothetical protein
MKENHTCYIGNGKQVHEIGKQSTTDGDRQGERDTGTTCAMINESEGTGPRGAWWKYIWEKNKRRKGKDNERVELSE